MVLIEKNKVIISRRTWSNLKQRKEFRELIEVIEDTAELEKAKKDAKHFIRLEVYLKEREKKEKRTKPALRKKRVRRRIIK